MDGPYGPTILGTISGGLRGCFYGPYPPVGEVAGLLSRGVPEPDIRAIYEYMAGDGHGHLRWEELMPRVRRILDSTDPLPRAAEPAMPDVASLEELIVWLDEKTAKYRDDDDRPHTHEEILAELEEQLRHPGQEPQSGHVA
jgi:hypothetical protein